MPKIAWAVLFGLFVWAPAASSGADDFSQNEMQGLDEEVQEIKSDVLGIAAELSRLEERLLYPSNTQLAVFITLAEGDEFRLDAVQIKINGELVAHYIYSFKELEALQKGGMQRIFTGNLPTGEHGLDVSYDGKLQNGEDFSRSESFAFTKGIEPKLLGITLAGSEFGTAGIQIGDW